MHEKDRTNNLNKAMVVFMFCLMVIIGISGSVFAHEDGEQDDDDDDEEWEEYGVVGIIGIGIFIVLMGIVVTFIGLWVYRDANSRGLDGTLWLIVMFVGNILGLIIYYIIRKEHPVRNSPIGSDPHGAGHSVKSTPEVRPPESEPPT